MFSFKPSMEDFINFLIFTRFLYELFSLQNITFKLKVVFPKKIILEILKKFFFYLDKYISIKKTIIAVLITSFMCSAFVRELCDAPTGKSA